MQEFDKLERSELIDLLADHTSLLTKLLQERNHNEEYLEVKQIIKQITVAIESKNALERNGTTPISFSWKA